MHTTKLKYHLILVTKYRKPILTDEVMDFIVSEIDARLRSFKITPIAIKGMI